MKIAFKRIISLLLVLILTFGSFPISGFDMFITKANAVYDEDYEMTVTVSGSIYCKYCKKYFSVSKTSIRSISASNGTLKLTYSFSIPYHRVSTIACDGANMGSSVTIEYHYNSLLYPCDVNININKRMHSSTGSYPDHTLYVNRYAGCTVKNYKSNKDNTHSGTCTFGEHSVTESCIGTANCTTNVTCSVCNGVVTASDNHDWGEWTSTGNNTHIRVCNRDSSHTSEQNCTGGSSTCLTPSACSVCSENYLDVNNHESDSFAYVQNTEDLTKHNKVYNCCGAVAETENHTWEYSSIGSTLTATCNTEGCSNTFGGNIEVLPPENCYVDGHEKNIILKNNLIDSSVDIGVIYSTEDGSAPKEAGQYLALVTLGDATVSISFEIEEFSITWIDGDDKTVESVNVGAEIQLPDKPQKVGYTFEGWVPDVPDIMPSENLTFTAKYNAISYEVIFNANGGAWAHNQTQKSSFVDYNSEIISPETPINQGYIFGGWESGGEILESNLGIMDSINGKTFTAHWIPSEDTVYTIETYTMNTEGEYEKHVQRLNGTTNEFVSITPTVDLGFTLNYEKSVLGGVILPDNSLVLKAYIDRNTYSLKASIDDSCYETFVYYGSEITLPEIPDKTGYTFNGWAPDVPDTMPAYNLAFTAIFTANNYDAVFNADGGSWADGKTENIVSTPYNSEIIIPDTPTRKGYVFAGWAPEVGVMDDINGKTFTAQWKTADDTPYVVETYTMNTLGGYDKTVENLVGTTNSTVTFSPVITDGFVLDNDKSVVSGEITAEGSLVLKVYINRKSYTLTTVSGDTSTSKTYLFGADVIQPDIPVKVGYRFVGWNSEYPKTMPAKNIVISALWDANSYNAIFDANSGKWSDSSDKKTFLVKYDSEIIPPEIPAKKGYIFSGWVYEGHNLGTNLGIMDNVNGKTFTACWIASTDTVYTVETYTMNINGEYIKSVQTLCGTTDEVVTAKPSVANGFSLNSEKSILEGVVSADNSLVLNVYIDRNIYTITEKVDGTEVKTAYYYGSPVSLITSPTKTGHTFVGWDNEIPSTMPAENIILTAVFSVNKYESIFDANGGKWSDGETSKAILTDYNNKIIVPESPSREGYIFSGWSPEVGLMDDVNGKKFVAVWTASTDTVYTVETYLMNTSGEYEKSSQTYTGTTGEATTAKIDISSGFSLNAEKSILGGIIEADNSLVLKVYIDRNTYILTTVVDEVLTQTAYLYGSIISEPVPPLKAGYKFICWDRSFPETMPAEDVTITAVFEKSYICPGCGNEILGEDAINKHIADETKVTISGGTVVSGELKPGATITVKAEQIDGKIFSHWVVNGAVVEDVNSSETKMVLENGKISITAVYDDCDCKCHQCGIVAFFFKIVLFFQKLFGKNLVCFCGAKH